MRIKEGIALYNANKAEDTPKMTLAILAEAIGKNSAIISLWGNGKRLNECRATNIKDICKVLNVDADFLIKGIEDTSELSELTLGGLLQVMKSTGKSPNAILKMQPMKNK